MELAQQQDQPAAAPAASPIASSPGKHALDPGAGSSLHDEPTAPAGTMAAPGKTAPRPDVSGFASRLGGGGSETPRPGRDASASGVRDAPTADYIVPFDHNPKSSPGERIICVAEFSGGAAGDYEIQYSSVGGKFGSAAGASTVTKQGLKSGNVDFFIPATWNGSSTMTVTMKLVKKSDGVAAHTETWTYGHKEAIPTTMTQVETTGERDLPGDYTYNLGPAIDGKTKPFYEHVTILERFQNWKIANVAPDDIKDEYRRTHALNSADAISQKFIGTYAGDNGTFTVDHDDQVGDTHGGSPNLGDLPAQLKVPKAIEVALPQVYEAKPGVTLQAYTVTRIRQTNGTWKVKKAPT